MTGRIRGRARCLQGERTAEALGSTMTSRGSCRGVVWGSRGPPQWDPAWLGELWVPDRHQPPNPWDLDRLVLVRKVGWGDSGLVFVTGRGGAGFHFVPPPLLRPGVNSLPFLPAPYDTGPWPGCGARLVFYFPR